ncbi:MAG TPA: hypothetical protein VLL75_12635, partial [Vicinamibacteria bacterium]|nr:hypothetical protein [Vicinamibacteria bacterium]
MLSRRRLLFLALFFLAGLLAVVLTLPQWLPRQMARTLSGVFRRPVSIGEVRFHRPPFLVEILDLRVEGRGPGETPFLEAPRVLVAPSFAPLRFGRLVLTRVRLEKPRIYIHSFLQGGDNLPKAGGAGGVGGGPQLSIGRVSIAGGELVLDHERVPLDLDLPDFQGRLLARTPRGLRGRLSFGPGTLRFGTAPILPVGAEMDIQIDGPVVTAEAGHIRARGTDLGWRGQVRFGGRTLGQFTVDGPVDLDMLDRHVMRTGFGIKGAGRFRGTVSVDGPRFRIDGRMEGTEGVFDGTPVEKFGGELAWSSDGVVLRRLDLTTLGGTGTLDVDVPSGAAAPRPVRIRGPLREVDAEALLRAVFKYGPLHLGSSATGELLVEWPKGRVRQISGAIAFDLAERPDGRTPLHGRFEWRAQEGVEWVERADLRTPTTRVRAAGRIESDDRTDLALDADSTDLGAADDILLRIRRALGNLEAQPTRFTGAGLFRGRWRGTLSLPVFEGRFSGRDISYLGVGWGRAEWAGSVDTVSVRSHSLVVSRAGAEIWMDGLMETGFFGGLDAIEAKVRLHGWPAEDIVKALSWDLDLEGPLTGEATVKGRRSRPEGSASISSSNGRYYGVPYEDARVVTQWREGVAAVREGQARLGGGRVVFRGSLTDEGIYDGVAEVAAVEPAAVLPKVSPALELGGRVSGRITLQGTLDRPRARAAFRSERLFVGDEGLGALEATLLGAGDGRLSIDARCRSARVDLALSGSIGAAPPYLADLVLRGRDTSVDPFLRAAWKSLPPPLGVIVSGEVKLRGPLRSPRALSGEA